MQEGKLGKESAERQPRRCQLALLTATPTPQGITNDGLVHGHVDVPVRPWCCLAFGSRPNNPCFFSIRVMSGATGRTAVWLGKGLG